MLNKFLTRLFTVALLFSSSLSFGAVQCPNPSAIKTIAFDEAQKGDHPGVWTMVQNNKTYHTANKWKFSLMLEADNQKAAFKKAKLALTHLRKVRGPDKVGKVWVCDYESSAALAGTAVSNS